MRYKQDRPEGSRLKAGTTTIYNTGKSRRDDTVIAKYHGKY